MCGETKIHPCWFIDLASRQYGVRNVQNGRSSALLGHVVGLRILSVEFRFDPGERQGVRKGVGHQEGGVPKEQYQGGARTRGLGVRLVRVRVQFGQVLRSEVSFRKIELKSRK